jgi:hypothetical protein
MSNGIEKAIFLIQTYCPPSDFTMSAIESIKKLKEENEELKKNLLNSIRIQKGGFEENG